MIMNTNDDTEKKYDGLCMTEIKMINRDSYETKTSLQKTDSGDDFTRRNNEIMISDFENSESLANLPTLKKGDGQFSEEKLIPLPSPRSDGLSPELKTDPIEISGHLTDDEQNVVTPEPKKTNKNLNRSLDISSLYQKGDSKFLGKHYPLIETTDGELEDSHSSFDKKVLYEENDKIFSVSVLVSEDNKEYDVPKQKRFSLRKETIESVNFPEVWFSVKHLKLIHERKLVYKEKMQGWNILKKYLCSCFIRRLSSNLLTEHDHIMAYSKMGFREDNPMNFRMLYTIYVTLTNDRNCPRVGHHWGKIGFSEEDPAKLLTKTGMFGILQIVAFVTFHRKFLLHCFNYSCDEHYGFMFCDLLLKVSRYTLKSLRDGYLQSLIENQKSVINAANNFFFATFYKIFRFYQTNKLEKSELKGLIQRLGVDIKREPELTINDFSQEINKYMNKHAVVKRLNFEKK